MFLPQNLLGVHPTVGRQALARRGGGIGVRLGGNSLECSQGACTPAQGSKESCSWGLDLGAWGGSRPWRNYIPWKTPGEPAGQNSLSAKASHLRQLRRSSGRRAGRASQTCAPPRTNTWNYLKSPLSLPPTPTCTPDGYHTFASVPQDVFLFGVGVGHKA